MESNEAIKLKESNLLNNEENLRNLNNEIIIKENEVRP